VSRPTTPEKVSDALADVGRSRDRSTLAHGEQPELPGQVRVWQWTEHTITSLDYPWPDDDRRFQHFVDRHGFIFEFRAGTEHYPIAETYSRDFVAESDALPYQYLVAILVGSHYELILAEHLPALLEVLRYLDPVINR
jgi:hypothetical protein